MGSGFSVRVSRFGGLSFGFRVVKLGFRGSGFSRFGVWISMFRGSGFRVSGSVFGGWGFEFGFQVRGFAVQGFEVRGYGIQGFEVRGFAVMGSRFSRFLVLRFGVRGFWCKVWR